MAPLAVDPEALFAAGSAVVGAGDGLGAMLSFSSAGFGANSGLDAAGVVFGLAYRTAAESLSKAATAVINALRHNGTKMQVCAANYSKAEAASTLGGGGGAMSPPGDPVTMVAPGPPGTLGPGEPPPVLWAVVQSFLDDLWPNGDVAALHAAGGRWRNFGGALSGMQGALNGSKSLVDAQQIAEGEAIDRVLTQIGACMAKIAEQCGKLAGALDDFANEIANAQHAIRDLLHRLGSLFDLWHGYHVISILDGDAIEEIKKIAQDINSVLHNLGREARATEQGIKQGMQVADGLVQGLEKYMRGEFTHFLGEQIGNPVATAFDTFVNVEEGVVKAALGSAQGMDDLDPSWFLIDPKGAADTWMGMTKTGLVNLIVNPDETARAYGAMLHVEDWRSDRPGLGFGENLFDVASLFIPGVGEAGAGAEGAAAAARGAEGSSEIADVAGTAGRGGGAAAGLEELGDVRAALGEISGASGGLTNGLERLSGDLPKPDPQVGGRPTSPPPPKPPEPPVEPTLPPVDSTQIKVPTEPPPAALGSGPLGRPGVPLGPHEPMSAPKAEPHTASVPAATGEPVPSLNPRVAEHVPAGIPLAPDRIPAEPAPAETRSAPAAALSTQPSELPVTHGGGPNGPGQGSSPGGGPPHGQPPSRDGTSHEPHDADGDHNDPGDRDNAPSAIDALSSDDLRAIADYTGLGSEDLNYALRSGALDASQIARVDALNSALEKLPAYDGPVFRGSDLPSAVLAQYQPGEVIVEDAFLSTTTDSAVARSPEFEGNVEFEIRSSTGRDISSFSMIPHEQEVLFRAGTRFYILAKIVDPLTGKTIIQMIERLDE